MVTMCVGGEEYILGKGLVGELLEGEEIVEETAKELTE
jgi:hypothetical protein